MASFPFHSAFLEQVAGKQLLELDFLARNRVLVVATNRLQVTACDFDWKIICENHIFQIPFEQEIKFPN